MAEELKNLIDYDRMKEQFFNELSSLLQGSGEVNRPAVSYEKGVTTVKFSLPFLNERALMAVLSLMKSHLENIRIHALGDGLYSFQAMNSNLFKTENMLDNLKVEIVALTGRAGMDITKKGNMTQEEINLSVSLFKLFYDEIKDDPRDRLVKLGASVYSDNGAFDWSIIAGYEDVKKKIRESIILPLQKPEMFDEIARLTRRNFESNRPKAILFDGAPGVGKTTVARIIACEAEIPLVYVPVESIMSKWYGQSSQNLAQIFDACEDLGNSILFIDEIDSLAGSRDGNMFEATRRILSVLLRRLDGIDSTSKTLTIGATNRKNDLDHALLSRFDQTINFPLPNDSERASIFSCYAKHLSAEELAGLASGSEGVSGRNIKDLCEYTERRWARKLIIKNIEARPPVFDFYKNTLARWMSERD